MKAVVFDTETTGLVDPEIVEVAYIPLGDIKFEVPEMAGEPFNQRYKPTKPIETGAMATHHILNSDVVDCPPSDSFEFPDCEYVVGHNIDYDINVAWFEGREQPKRICTLAMSRLTYPDISHKQGSVLYHILGEPARGFLKDAHSALADVIVCRMLLDHFIQLHDLQTWEEVYAFSEDARIPRVMAFGKWKTTAIVDLPQDYVNWFLRQPDIDPYLEKALRNRK